MNTHIDEGVLSVFFKSQPKPVPLGELEDNHCWNSFYEFIKTHSNIVVYGHEQFSSLQTIFLTSLTTGRGDSKISFDNKPWSCYKNEVKCNDPLSFYCLEEKDEASQLKYRKKNGFLFAFENDLFNVWKQFSVLKPITKKNVRKHKIGQGNTEMDFGNWSQIADYLTPFTDAVLIDNYILNDPSLVPSNLEKIMIELDRATPVKYNLTVYSFESDRPNISREKAFEIVKEIKTRNQLKCELELVISNRELKEHDRGIFTNYLRIRSGDSFNYFNSKGEVISHGTDISFNSMANKNERMLSMRTLADVAYKIDEMKSKNVDRIFGSCKNRLLNQAKLMFPL
ncbi:hypothetical protein [Mangrovibacterium lignilyticum]|uniref:hypothetical protein n=1 Tax=Mangrovibacterium lignilyticum TaxID=2668052 RepID=UPI0013D7ABB3|nr:hypothetical protein [Mangrovibacterium lignilyticum]